MEFDRKLFARDSVLLSGREALNRFLDEKQVQFAFQPIVDAKTGTVFAYEALMRPQCKELPSVGEVMRLAKAQSKLYQIELLTWNGVLAAMATQRSALKYSRVFINSVPNMVLTQADEERLEQEYSVWLPKMVIEIVESEQLESDCITAKRRFAEKWGASIALDDFGSGYSTESTLLSLSPHFVKIDMSIVQGIAKDADRHNLVANVLSYAHKRGMKIIAEGVETREDLYALLELGVDYLQGYYLAKPNLIVSDLKPYQKDEILDMQAEITRKQENVK